MAKSRKLKTDTAIVVALVGLLGTVIVGILNSPLLIKIVEQMGSNASATPQPTVTATATPIPVPQGLHQVFRANFEDGSKNGLGFESGDWEVVSDQTNYVLRGTAVGDTAPAAVATFGPNDFSDGVVEYRIRFITSSPGLYCDFRLEYDRGSYLLYFNPAGQTVVLATNLRVSTDWEFAEVAPGTTRSFSIRPDTWYQVRLETRGENISLKINGNEILSVSDSRLKQGQLRFTLDPQAIVDIDDISVSILAP